MFFFLNPSPRQIASGEDDPLPPEVIEEAQAVARAQEEEPPFMPSSEMLYAAYRALMGGRFREAVLDAGTGIELLVNTSIREIGPQQGDSDESVERALNKGFASRVRDDFARLFGFAQTPDESEDALGEWWRKGYTLRNRVTHEGHLPTVDEAAEAFSTAQKLTDAVGEAILRDPDIREAVERAHERHATPPDAAPPDARDGV